MEQGPLRREQLRSLPADRATAEFRQAWGEWVEYLTERNLGRPLASQTLDRHLLSLVQLTPEISIEALRLGIAKNSSVPLPPFPKAYSGPAGAAALPIPEGAPPEAWTGGLKENTAP